MSYVFRLNVFSGLSKIEYVKMGVMGFLSFLAMGHLVLMIYGLLKEAYTIDVLSVSVIAFLYIAG